MKKLSEIKKMSIKKIVTIKVKEPLFDDIDNSFNYISKVIKKSLMIQKKI